MIVRPHPGQRADTLAPALGAAVAQLDSNLPTYFGGTPARLHDEALGVQRITATLFTIFGIVAIVLSSVGLYGVMSFERQWQRLIVILAAFPLAIAGNVFRLLCIIGAAEAFGQETGTFVHDNFVLSLLPYVPAIVGLLLLGKWLRERSNYPVTN
jgi:exosortase/archaeosortase family protein